MTVCLFHSLVEKPQLFLCFLPFIPPSLSILQFFRLTAEFSQCELRSPFPLSLFLYVSLPPSLSLLSAVPYCWEANVIIIFLLSSSLFLPLFLSLRLPLIHYPSLTTVLCRCEVDPTLGRPSLLTVSRYLSIYPPTFLLSVPLTVSFLATEMCHCEKRPSLSSSIKCMSLFFAPSTLCSLVSVTVASFPSTFFSPFPEISLPPPLSTTFLPLTCDEVQLLVVQPHPV